MYYVQQIDTAYLLLQFGATLCSVIDNGQCLNVSQNTDISVGRMLWPAVNTKSLQAA
jgi:hypothetical protein